MPPHRPPLPSGLYAICDDGVRPDLPVERQAEQILSGGARVVQVRLKRTEPRAAVDICRAVAARCRAAGALCLVNDRVDWALLAFADGVHVGDQDLPPEAARALLGPARLLGVTARDARMAEAARRAGADYVGVGPVFATATKRVEAEAMGLARLAEVVRQSPLPVAAISGIGLHNIHQVARTGARMAAVISDLLLSEDIPARAHALEVRFQAGSTRHTLSGR